MLKYISLFGLLTIVLTSCKINEASLGQPQASLPKSFMNQDDTSSVGDLDWEVFFNDPQLIGLIDQALDANFDVQIAQQRLEMAQALLQVRRGALLPNVSMVGSAGVERFGDYTMNGVGNFDTNLSEFVQGDRVIPNPTPDFFVGFRAAWEVDLWGKLRNQRKAAYARLLASEKGRQLLETQIVAEVAALYYELLALDAEMEILQKNIALQQSALDIVRIQKTAGRVTEMAVNQFSAQLYNTQSLEARIRQRRVAAENHLNLLLGRFPQPIERGGNMSTLTIPDTIRAGLPSGLLLRRPDIQLAEWELNATKADVEAARAAFLPSFTLAPYVGFNAFKTSLLFNPGSAAYGLLGGLSAPLLNRNELKGQYKQAVAQQKEAYLAYQKTIVLGFQEVMTQLNQIDNLKKETSFKRNETSELAQAVDASQQLFLAGSASYLEVVTAQKSVLEANLELVELQKAQFISLVNLYRALGGGWK